MTAIKVELQEIRLELTNLRRRLLSELDVMGKLQETMRHKVAEHDAVGADKI